MSKRVPYRHFKVRWQKRGGHVHADMFVANHPAQTFQNMGELVMSKDDFKALRAAMPRASFEERIKA